MLIVPLVAVQFQKFSVLLNGQNCQVSLYQKTTGLYIDLSVNNAPIVQCVLCKDRVNIAEKAYLGFVGSLKIVDTLGKTDPVWTGLGQRYKMVYQ